MAIIHNITDLDTMRPLHNNFIAAFRSSTIQAPTKAIISILGSDFIFSPDITGSFTVNLSSIAKYLFTANGYADAQNAFNISYSNFTAINPNIGQFDIIITVYSASTSDSTTIAGVPFFNGVLQPENAADNIRRRSSIEMLYANTIEAREFIYTDGYPFDVSLSAFPEIIGASATLLLANLTTGNYTLLMPIYSDAIRIFINDGDVSFGEAGGLPVVYGANDFVISTVDGSKKAFFSLFKRETECGRYIKWYNDFGGFNYWLFEEGIEAEVSVNTNKTGYNNQEDVFTSTSDGFTSGVGVEKSLTISSGYVYSPQSAYFKSIFYAPKVYIYTGAPYSVKNSNSWQEVQISGKYKTTVPKTNSDIYTITFNSRRQNTITL